MEKRTTINRGWSSFGNNRDDGAVCCGNPKKSRSLPPASGQVTTIRKGRGWVRDDINAQLWSGSALGGVKQFRRRASTDEDAAFLAAADS